MTDEQRDPWDRRDGESAGDYVRFLHYRNLGVGRSLSQAYRIYCQTPGRDADRARVQTPGNWCRASQEYEWASRAEAWDVQVLLAAGEHVARKIAEAMADAAVAGIRSEVTG